MYTRARTYVYPVIMKVNCRHKIFVMIVQRFKLKKRLKLMLVVLILYPQLYLQSARVNHFYPL
jgi:hypothetical protein